MAEPLPQPLPPDFWRPFPEDRWRELAAACRGISEAQIRFAVARFNGFNQKSAAKLAYGCDDKHAAGVGYQAARQNAVVSLLELASVEAPGEAGITAREVEAKLARMIRSNDATTALKAIEINERREARKAEALAADRDKPGNPIESLKALAKSNPVAAVIIAANNNIDIPEIDVRKLLDQPCPVCCFRQKLKDKDAENAAVAS